MVYENEVRVGREYIVSTGGVAVSTKVLELCTEKELVDEKDQQGVMQRVEKEVVNVVHYSHSLRKYAKVPLKEFAEFAVSGESSIYI